MAKIALKIPWPPSANRYWRSVGGLNKPYVSPEARKYIALIKTYNLLKKTCFHGRISLYIEAFPPDKRKRDIDNVLKVVCDSFEKAGFFLNDSQIDRIYIERMPKLSGELHVEISEIE